jgi:hypothetical protein
MKKGLLDDATLEKSDETQLSDGERAQSIFRYRLDLIISQLTESKELKREIRKFLQNGIADKPGRPSELSDLAVYKLVQAEQLATGKTLTSIYRGLARETLKEESIKLKYYRGKKAEQTRKK